VSVFSLAKAVERLDKSNLNDPSIVIFANTNLATMQSSINFSDKRLVILNDGIGIDIASKILYGKFFKDNLAGTDFIPHFLENSINSHKIFILGSTGEIVQAAAEKIGFTFPRHSVVGFKDGFFNDTESAVITERIRNSGATLLICAMGNPKQEMWLTRHFDDTGCHLGMGVGAYLDFLTANKPRAPKLFRSLRIEWFFRLMLEPKRLASRYTFGISKFFIW
jgi:alpha-1,3-mannosyltransferase